MPTPQVIKKVHPLFQSYVIYSDGRVWSDFVNRFLIMSPRIDGYVPVILYDKARGLKKGFLLHRLILETFKGPPKNKSIQASHINGKRADNRLSNLVWETAVENNQRKKDHGTYRFGEKCCAQHFD